MTSIIENKIICEGKIAEVFYFLSKLDEELQLEIIKDIQRRIENLKGGSR